MEEAMMMEATEGDGMEEKEEKMANPEAEPMMEAAAM